MTRSAFGISAIFASTTLSPSALPARRPPRAAFTSWARSFIAAFSSSENPFDFLPVVLSVAVMLGAAAPTLASMDGVKARAAETAGALGVVETVIPVGHSTPLHVHQHEDEAFYILAGAVDFVRGDERFRAEDGDFVFLPRTVPHTFLGISEEPTRALVIFLPGGLEEAFAEPSRFHEVLREHDVEVVGPPLT
jgi:mannose-6-phosphate isomerase-like protein (cupin superfamily)